MKDDWCKQLLDKTEEQMEIIANEDINSNNIEYLDKLVDIHKDLENEKYWDYHEYAEGRDSYGADDGQTLQSLEYMMKSVVEFIAMLQDDAKSQDEVEIIKKYTRKISEM